MKVKEIFQLIESDGRYKVAQKGSHRQFKYLSKMGRVTVPDHGANQDLAKSIVY